MDKQINSYDLAKEAEQYYPDRGTNLETRTDVLTMTLKYLEYSEHEISISNLENPRALVLGSGRGADIDALININDSTEVLRAVDVDSEALDKLKERFGIQRSRDDNDEPVRNMEISEYLVSDDGKSDVLNADIIMATRISKNTLNSILQNLGSMDRREGQQIILTTDDIIDDSSYNKFIFQQGLNGSVVETNNPGETVIVLT